MPHVAIEDCGYYARWLFDNTERANGMNLEVAIEHVNYHKHASAFEKVTGQPARDIDRHGVRCLLERSTQDGC